MLDTCICQSTPARRISTSIPARCSSGINGFLLITRECEKRAMSATTTCLCWAMRTRLSMLAICGRRLSHTIGAILFEPSGGAWINWTHMPDPTLQRICLSGQSITFGYLEDLIVIPNGTRKSRRTQLAPFRAHRALRRRRQNVPSDGDHGGACPDQRHAAVAHVCARVDCRGARRLDAPSR